MSSFKDGGSFRYYSNSGEHDVAEEYIDPPPSAVDTLKISHVSNVYIANKTIENYQEDCIDMVGAKGCTLENISLIPLGRNGITIKGSSFGILFNGLSFQGPGEETEICLGDFDNYWYPGRPPTTWCSFAGTGRGETPVRIKLIDADEPVVTFPHVFIKVPKWKWFHYFCYRYVLLRIKNLITAIAGGVAIDTTPYKPGTLQPV